MLFAFCILGVQATHAQTPDTAAIRTIINHIKANTEKITSYYAAFTIKEDSLKADATHACVPRNESWAYGKGPVGQSTDTVIFSEQIDTGWIHHNSQTGSTGEQFPNYEHIFMLNFLSDTFPDSWINAYIDAFDAVVDTETNDSIVLTHMNSSVHFSYTVDKHRWVVTHINAGGYDVYDAIYTWNQSAGGIYYPSAITLSLDGDLCDGKYAFTSIKLNGASMTSVLPRSGTASAAGRSNAVSVALTRSPDEKVVIPLANGENIREVSITDLAGRVVQTLAGTGTFAPGRTILWDGKGSASQQVHAGVYFFTVTTDRSHVSARLPLVK
jgi:hypothetical protein